MNDIVRAAVLVVEDEPLMRMAAVDLAEDTGFASIEAWNVDDAMLILASRDDIHIVFSDIDLGPGGDGLKLAHAVRDRWPPIGIIVVSGKRRVERQSPPANGLFFEKPYRRDQVAAAMQRLAAKGRDCGSDAEILMAQPMCDPILQRKRPLRLPASGPSLGRKRPKRAYARKRTSYIRD